MIGGSFVVSRLIGNDAAAHRSLHNLKTLYQKTSSQTKARAIYVSRDDEYSERILPQYGSLYLFINICRLCRESISNISHEVFTSTLIGGEKGSFVIRNSRRTNVK